MVELDRIREVEKPAFLRDLKGYRFWKETTPDKFRQMGYPVPQSEDTEYYDCLADLSYDLASALKNRNQADPVPAAKATVYVAPVNDSLYDQRVRLTREFEYVQDVFESGHKNTLFLLLESLMDHTERIEEKVKKRWRKELPSKSDKDLAKMIEILIFEKHQGVSSEETDPNGKLSQLIVEAPVNDADKLGREAVFAETIRTDYPHAEQLYELAIDVDPGHAINLGKYALFMETLCKDYPRAEQLYEQAIEADPTDATNLGNYAVFMVKVLKVYPRAKELYEQAIEADPEDSHNLGNYAQFMEIIRKDYSRAEELNGQAFEAAMGRLNQAELLTPETPIKCF